MPLSTNSFATFGKGKGVDGYNTGQVIRAIANSVEGVARE